MSGNIRTLAGSKKIILDNQEITEVQEFILKVLEEQRNLRINKNCDTIWVTVTSESKSESILELKLDKNNETKIGDKKEYPKTVTIINNLEKLLEMQGLNKSDNEINKLPFDERKKYLNRLSEFYTNLHNGMDNGSINIPNICGKVLNLYNPFVKARRNASKGMAGSGGTR